MRNYEIDLTDITGVGPKTAEQIRSVLADYVEEDEESVIPALHLLAKGGHATRTLEENGLGRDVLGTLRAIGRAIDGPGPARVKAKHLTGGPVDTDTRPSALVRIDAADDSDSSPTDSHPESDGATQLSDFIASAENAPSTPTADEESSPPPKSAVANALETIRDEYGDTYPEWLRFQNETADFLASEASPDLEIEGFWEANQHMPVVRYQQIDVDTVLGYDEFTDEHAIALVAFARSLSPTESQSNPTAPSVTQ